MEHSQVIYCHFEVATSFLDMFLVIVWWWKSLHPTKGPFFRWVGWHKCWKSSAMLHPEMSRSGSQRYAKPLHLPETNNYIWLHYVIMNNRMPPKIWKPLNLLNHSIYLWSTGAPFPTLCCLWQTANPPRPRCICAHWNRSDQPFVRCEKNVFHLLTWNPLFTHAPWRIRAIGLQVGNFQVKRLLRDFFRIRLDIQETRATWFDETLRKHGRNNNRKWHGGDFKNIFDWCTLVYVQSFKT